MNSLIGFPCTAIPKLGTQAHTVLTMLMKSGYSTSSLTIGLGGKNPRSALQSLMNETYGCWNIINVGINGSQEGFYRLDPRHLSNNPELDKQARQERFLALRAEQKERGLKTTNKLPSIIKAWKEAEDLFNPQLKLPISDNKKPA